ncbi:MAG: 1-deoxy-D-xylulose-5-phosphate synthase N-terminal domain-containing protein, partial [Eubacteriales bacterium]
MLPRIHGPADVQKLNMEEMEQLCRDIRARLLETVSQTGGHLSSNLGVVELTVALHH